MSSHISNERPAPDKVLTDIADYALSYKVESELAYSTAQYCLIDTLGCGLEALEYPACTKTARPHRARHHRSQRRARSRHQLPARSRAGGLQYRRHDSLARLQRHLAGRRVGTPLRQSRRHSRRRRLALAQPCGRQTFGDDARCADGHDQGPRDSGLHRARKLVQQGRPRSRRAGQGRIHRRRQPVARPHARADHHRALAAPGSTARACAPIATRPTPARAKAGPRATPPAAPCAWR